MSDDVAAVQTPGFKVGEKKTLDEYHKLGELCLTILNIIGKVWWKNAFGVCMEIQLLEYRCTPTHPHAKSG
jgi:hypothetical protein